MLKNKLAKQIFRFSWVGILCFFIDFSVLYLLTEFIHINYLISAAFSFCVSLIVNYILSTKIVFHVSDRYSKTKKFIVFCMLSVVGLGINQLLMWLGTDKLGIYYMLVKLGATAIVMVYNFITRKIFLER